MSTVSELFEQGHLRVRLPKWNHLAFIQLDRIAVGERETLGPWCSLVDPCGYAALGNEYPSEKLLWMLFGIGDDWEAFTGEPPSDDDLINIYKIGWNR